MMQEQSGQGRLGTAVERREPGSQPRARRPWTRVAAGAAVLSVAAIGLGFGLGAAYMGGDDHSSADGMAHQAGSGYAGMMGAMAGMRSDAMLERMREVLGEGSYQAVLQHMRAHRDGTAGTLAPGVDGAMHQMMDGMMSTMPPDSHGQMFPNKQMPMQGMSGNQN